MTFFKGLVAMPLFLFYFFYILQHSYSTIIQSHSYNDLFEAFENVKPKKKVLKITGIMIRTKLLYTKFSKKVTIKFTEETWI